MNELNYATQPASKRLLDVGIVLETEAVWCRTGRGWRLHLKYKAKMYKWLEVIPAPSMVEVWRELISCGFPPCSDGDNFWICDGNADEISPEMSDPNPADALIDLLIWVTEQKRRERRGEKWLPIL